MPGWRDLVREPPPGSHILQIYEDFNQEIETATLFVAEGLRKGERVCCLGSARELAAIRRRVENGGPFGSGSSESGKVMFHRSLNGEGRAPEGIDRPTMDGFLSDLFCEVPNRYPSVRVWGNRIARFFESGLFAPSLSFEELCQERRERLPWTVLCAYNARKLIPERHAAAFWEVLRRHTHMIPAGDFEVALELFPNGVHR